MMRHSRAEAESRTVSLTISSVYCVSGWTDPHIPVSEWYKVGVLGSRVHSVVMSSNNMVGPLPKNISQLTQLRMIELATMPGNTFPFLRSFVSSLIVC
jgi:hypothetical protein